MSNSKPVYKSMTFGAATLNVAVLHLIPGAREWVSENPVAYGEILTVAMIGLRLVTQKAVSWTSKKL